MPIPSPSYMAGTGGLLPGLPPVLPQVPSLNNTFGAVLLGAFISAMCVPFNVHTEATLILTNNVFKGFTVSLCTRRIDMCTCTKQISPFSKFWYVLLMRYQCASKTDTSLRYLLFCTCMDNQCSGTVYLNDESKYPRHHAHRHIHAYLVGSSRHGIPHLLPHVPT